MKTWHIHIEGQVQGVGFRPFVYQLARQQQLCGWVNNTVDGVHIVFNATAKQAENFLKELLKSAPRLSRITRHQLRQIQARDFTDFQIVHSQLTGEASLLLSPDFALCADCRAELHDAGNRRHHYPFITCTLCGPRYSIIRHLPYDRETTTMASFDMCPECKREYDDPYDRRYYSQTNSCRYCCIELSLVEGHGKEISKDPEVIIPKIVQLWEQGKIIAIKGIGGYLLTCDANQAPVIREMRKRKHRPTKPFALMYPDVATIHEQLTLPKVAEEELNSYRAPIILLEQQTHTSAYIAAGEIAPDLSQIGVMLPYTPFFDQLLQSFGRPIIATSANISNSPIVFEDKKAWEKLPQIADYILSNNRSIVLPQDDSLVKYSPFHGQKIILRRSRGIAPTFIQAELQWPDQTLLATGAMLKSSFCLLHQKNTYISQYLGDLEHFDTEQSYRHTIQHFLQLFDASPKRLLTDKHPEYASTRYGLELAADLQIPVEQVQHHIAHFGAIIGEHQLMHQPEPVLGVIWDGTGLGDDRKIWGGEFFKYENYHFTRSYHFDYFDFMLGDKMPKEPRISALSSCWGLPEAEQLTRAKFSKTEWQIYRKMLEKGSNLKTSSLGRIFDAVAALLGLMDKQSFEGEAAMRLEQLALSYCQKEGLDLMESYLPDDLANGRIPTKGLLRGLLQDLQKGKSIDFIAAKFHYTLAILIKIIAKKLHIHQIACSGGVFQNSLLVDMIIHHLASDFKLYFHRELSPNDENISFGQLICFQIKQHKKSVAHVLSNSR